MIGFNKQRILNTIHNYYEENNFQSLIREKNVKLCHNVWVDKDAECIWPSLHNRIINTLEL